MIWAKCVELAGLRMLWKSCDFLKVFIQAWSLKNVYSFQGKMGIKRHGYGLWFSLCKKMFCLIQVISK